MGRVRKTIADAYQALRQKAGLTNEELRNVESATLSAVVQHRPGSTVQNLDSITDFYDEGYRQNPIVRACVTKIAGRAKQVPWRLKRGIGEDEEDITDADGLPRDLRGLANILRQPNRLQGWGEHIEETVINKLVAGEYYWELLGPPDGFDEPPIRLVGFQNMSPMNVTPVSGRMARSPIQEFELSAGETPGRGGVRETLPPERVLFGRFYDPNSFFRGLSPMGAAGRAIQRMNEYDEWNIQLAQNLGKVGGILAYDIDSAPGPEQIDQAKEAFEQAHQGTPGEPMVTGALKDYIETGMSPVDADWVEGHQNARELICSVYSVPKELINLGSATFENRREARKTLMEEAVLPVLRSIKEELNRCVDSIYDESVYFELDTSSVSALQEDRNRKHERLMDLYESGAIEDTELRRMHPDIQEADFPGEGTRWMPSSQLPATSGGEGLEEAMADLEQNGYTPHYLDA